MRRRYVYDREHDRMVEVVEAPRERLHEIMPDIGRYRSMVDGSVVDGRRQHEEHLKRNGVRVVEPGEVRKEDILKYRKDYNVAPKERLELIRAQVDSMTHEKFKAAVKRDIDNWKWNSRTE